MMSLQEGKRRNKELQIKGLSGNLTVVPRFEGLKNLVIAKTTTGDYIPQNSYTSEGADRMELAS